jgi:hypothetical protein
MPYFLCRLKAPRPTFMQDMTDAERALMGEHIVYWRGFIERGVTIAFGPVLDPAGPWGMGLVEVADIAEIQALVAADPVMAANRGFACDVLPMPHGIIGRAAEPETHKPDTTT